MAGGKNRKIKGIEIAIVFSVILLIIIIVAGIRLGKREPMPTKVVPITKPEIGPEKIGVPARPPRIEEIEFTEFVEEKAAVKEEVPPPIAEIRKKQIDSLKKDTEIKPTPTKQDIHPDAEALKRIEESGAILY